MTITLVLACWLFGALVGVSAAQRRGFSTAAGVVGGILLGPLAPLLFFVSPTLRRCPSCAEFVQPEAALCKHCRTPLDPSVDPTRTPLLNRVLSVLIGLMVVLVVLAVLVRSL